MKRNELWPREEEVRVTGCMVLRTRGRGDERQICKYKKEKLNREVRDARLRDISGHWNLWLSGAKAGWGGGGKGTGVRRFQSVTSGQAPLSHHLFSQEPMGLSKHALILQWECYGFCSYFDPRD